MMFGNEENYIWKKKEAKKALLQNPRDAQQVLNVGVSGSSGLIGLK